MKRLLIGTLVFLAGSVGLAQTVTPKASWNPGPDTSGAVVSAATAGAYNYTLKLGATVVPMGAVTCTAVAGVVGCSAPLTAPVAPGTYTLTVTNGVGSPATTDPYIAAGATKPTVFTISITITVP